MFDDDILEYNNKILLQERKKQKISLESAASSITLSINQVKSIENNLDDGFINAHFKSMGIKRYAKFLGVDLSKIIISNTRLEKEVKTKSTDTENFKIILLSNLTIIKNNILIILILISSILYLIFGQNLYIDDTNSIIEIKTSNVKISKEIYTDDNILPPVTKDFSKLKKLKVIPEQNNTDALNNIISPSSIEFLCSIKSASMDKIWSHAYPEKPATYFHIVSRAKQSICTVDNRGIFKQYNLDAGAKITHRGEAPFKIQLNPSISQLYFQGWKVILGESDSFVQLNPVKMSLELN